MHLILDTLGSLEAKLLQPAAQSRLHYLCSTSIISITHMNIMYISVQSARCCIPSSLDSRNTLHQRKKGKLSDTKPCQRSRPAACRAAGGLCREGESVFLTTTRQMSPTLLQELYSKQPSSLSMSSCITDRQHGDENEHALSANLPGMENKKNTRLMRNQHGCCGSENETRGDTMEMKRNWFRMVMRTFMNLQGAYLLLLQQGHVRALQGEEGCVIISYIVQVYVFLFQV